MRASAIYGLYEWRAGLQDRWVISNNLITFYDPKLVGGSGNSEFMFYQGKSHLSGANGQMRGVLYQHNTSVPASQPCKWSIYFALNQGQTPPFHGITKNVWIVDNVLCRQPTGDFGQQGTSGLQQYMGEPASGPGDINTRFSGNVIYVPPGDKGQGFPRHNMSTNKSLHFT